MIIMDALPVGFAMPRDFAAPMEARRKKNPGFARIGKLKPNATYSEQGKGMPRDWWSGPPGPRGTPPSRCRHNGVSISRGANRPTGASAADGGVRPNIYPGARQTGKVSGIGLKPTPLRDLSGKRTNNKVAGRSGERGGMFRQFRPEFDSAGTYGRGSVWLGA